MEWTIRLEARTGWGEVTTCEIGALRRSLGELTADGVGLGPRAVPPEGLEATLTLIRLWRRVLWRPMQPGSTWQGRAPTVRFVTATASTLAESQELLRDCERLMRRLLRRSRGALAARAT